MEEYDDEVEHEHKSSLQKKEEYGVLICCVFVAERKTHSVFLQVH